MNVAGLIVLLIGLAIVALAMFKTYSENVKYGMLSSGAVLFIVGITMLSSGSQSNFKYVNSHGRDYLGYDKYEDPEETE